MSTQMTIRIPDELAAFVDKQVTDHQAKSRADAIASALLHEQRRQAAERDAAIYAADGVDPEIQSIVAFASNNIPAID